MDRIRQTLQYINGTRRCFGCGACSAACRKSALKMETDPDGFLFPQMDFTLCIKCGACRRACPVNAPDQTPDRDPEFFVARHRKLEVRRESTSGGAFSAFSDVVLARGGMVAGAVWTPEFSARHAIAGTAADLKAGSKVLPVRLKKLLADEAQRAEFEAEVMEGMSLQQQVNCKMPEVRRTRDPQKAAVCMKEYRKLLRFLLQSVKTGDKVGIGKNAYYGRLVDPWLLNDIRKKIRWCGSIRQK